MPATFTLRLAPPHWPLAGGLAGTILLGVLVQGAVGYLLWTTCVRGGGVTRLGRWQKAVALGAMGGFCLAFPFGLPQGAAGTSSGPLCLYALGGLCFVGAFKVFEVLYGRVPDQCILKERKHFLAYFVFPVEVEFESGKVVAPTSNKTLLKGQLPERTPLAYFLLAALRVACLVPLIAYWKGGHYAPTSNWYVNNYVGAWCTYLFLSLFMDVVALAQSLLGYRGIVTFRSPLLCSTSPRDMWGRRWNMIIHGLIHRSVFSLLFSRTAANPKTDLLSKAIRAMKLHLAPAVTGFFVSGCLHEYVLLAAFRQAHLQRHLGMQMQFFMIQGLISSAEVVARPMVLNLLGLKHTDIPKACLVAMTTALMIPWVGLFMEPLIYRGVFDEIALLLPKAYIVW